MKNFLFIGVITLLFLSCKKETKYEYLIPDWTSRKIEGKIDSLISHKTYLPLYAQIYQRSQDIKVDLTVTVSIRNTDVLNRIFLKRIDYYNTEGKLIRKYLDWPVFVKPSETIEIILPSNDNEGGTGANFDFEWLTPQTASKPVFESIMISTQGQQGIAFTCRGVDLK